MIHAVLCKGAAEKDAVVKVYQDAHLIVTWYGPDDFAQAEKFANQLIVDCTDCAVGGPDAYLVVARPAGVISK